MNDSDRPAAYDLLVFDLDGTLIDSVGDIADALNGALAELGLSAHDDATVATMVGEGVHELARKALGGSHLAYLEVVVSDYRRRYQAHPVARSRLYPGVAETVAALAPIPRAVATNKPGAISRAILERVGLDSQLFAVLGEDDVDRRKPDPQMVDLLRERTGAHRSRTLFVGDSPIDAATARAAGVDLCLVEYGYADPATLAAEPARYRIGRFADLLLIVHPERLP